jgi:ubiquinone/menaquinone biosynthesis C-methylase UbiE
MVKTGLVFLAIILASCNFLHTKVLKSNRIRTTPSNLQIEAFNNEIKKYNLIDGDTLVDIGSAEGAFASQIFQSYPNKFYILEDIKQYKNIYPIGIYINSQLKKFSDYSTKVIGTPDTIPLRSNAYKTVLCRKTVHEFNNPSKMVSELKRILAPNGALIIVEPIPEKPGEIYPDCKKKKLSKEEITSLFESQNLKVVSFDTTTYKKSWQYENLYIITFRK